MVTNSKFESRTGRLSCTDIELFGFISDIRNLGQFIPENSITNWNATADSCSFNVPSLGVVNSRITERNPYSSVGFSGEALQMNDFMIDVQIGKDMNNMAEVKITLLADLNPFLKMMASGPIERFLEILISEMEKFEKWDVTFKQSQPL
jgi:hypothetical protein